MTINNTSSLNSGKTLPFPSNDDQGGQPWNLLRSLGISIRVISFMIGLNDQKHSQLQPHVTNFLEMLVMF